MIATPHYEEEYGDSFHDEVTVEFGPELVHVLTATDRLVAPHYRELLAAARESVRNRAAFSRALGAEAESLERIDERLSEVELRAFEAAHGPLSRARSTNWSRSGSYASTSRPTANGSRRAARTNSTGARRPERPTSWACSNGCGGAVAAKAS